MVEFIAVGLYIIYITFIIVIISRGLTEYIRYYENNKFLRNMVKLIIRADNNELINETNKLYERSVKRNSDIVKVYPNLVVVFDQICYIIQQGKEEKKFKLNEAELAKIRNKYKELEKYIEKEAEQVNWWNITYQQKQILVDMKKILPNSDMAKKIINSIVDEFRRINTKTRRSDIINIITIVVGVVGIIVTVIAACG